MTKWHRPEQVQAMIESAVAPLRAGIATLEAENAQLRARVDPLESEHARLRKDSSTSSKPPSSDIVKPPSLPRPGGKRKKGCRGGQPHHPRHLRPPFLLLTATLVRADLDHPCDLCPARPQRLCLLDRDDHRLFPRPSRALAVGPTAVARDPSTVKPHPHATVLPWYPSPPCPANLAKLPSLVHLAGCLSAS